jgi:hypothetical protein
VRSTHATVCRQGSSPRKLLKNPSS